MTRFELRRRETTDLTLTRELELLTPMAGGSAVARMVDEQQPVNGKSVRGQLRFWWRATRGGRYGEGGLAQLRRDEAWLFGRAATFDETEKDLGPSRVQVTVETLQAGRSADYRRGSAPDYAAFPFADNRKENIPAAPLLSGLRFRVRLTVADHVLAEAAPRTREGVTADLEAALWAWITFGGVGARTRRGFGALGEVGQRSTLQTFTADLKRHVLPGVAPAGISQLDPRPERSVVLDGYDSPQAAWKEGIEVYKEFRQFRRPGSPTPHRSYWPEPDEIRRLTRDSAPAHAQPVTEARKFPRAALGLPIIFHFKGDRNDPSRQGDPRDTTLRGEQTERLASPVIIRPLAGGLLMATVLRHARHPGDPLTNLMLMKKNRGTDRVQHQLTEDEVRGLQAKVRNDESQPVQFGTDIPAAFLAYLKESLK
jgi:CRISPR-associated protein Cmr1